MVEQVPGFPLAGRGGGRGRRGGGRGYSPQAAAHASS